MFRHRHKLHPGKEKGLTLEALGVNRHVTDGLPPGRPGDRSAKRWAVTKEGRDRGKENGAKKAPLCRWIDQPQWGDIGLKIFGIELGGTWDSGSTCCARACLALLCKLFKYSILLNLTKLTIFTKTVTIHSLQQPMLAVITPSV